MNASVDDKRVIPDYDNVCDDIDEILSKFRAMGASKLFRSSLGQEALQTIKEYDTAIKKRLHDTFNVVIIGEFKRGKSTLINALLGENILPTAVTPETVTINRLSYADAPGAEAVLQNKKRAFLDKTELRREVLEQVMEKLPAPVDYIEIKENADILKNITIIDTPGIGEIMKSFDQQVADYLINADALVYVLSARAPLSLTEQTFISSFVLPQSFSRVFLVLNMADTLETVENIEKVRKLTTERAASISPDISVFAVSALDELCRKLNLKRPEPELATYLEAGYLEFENALKNDIIFQKDIIKSTRSIALTRMLLKEITLRVNLLQNSLDTAASALAASEEACRNQNGELLGSIDRHKAALAGEIDKMKAEAKGWMEDFMARLKTEIQQIRPTVSVNDLERHFQFYMMDTIRQAMLVCVERHNKDITDLLETASKSFASDVSSSSFGSINTKIVDCIADIGWTSVDTTMFFVTEVLGFSSENIGPLFLVGQAVAGFVRQKTVSKKQEDYLGNIIKEYDAITPSVLSKVDEIYSEIKRSTVGKLDELYRKQLEASEEAIRQAKEISMNKDIKREEITGYFEEILDMVESSRKQLDKYN